ncbi:MAG TPA: hypothetical protein VJJ52_05425 [Candidatus Nanoarchaeia archaeon]|nr:hypothetical protein [Candidatus Nanoarchaeia archaeon]
MAKNYSELEAWGIFAGALVIGVVLTSLFWAYITISPEDKILQNKTENLTKSFNAEIPTNFVNFCSEVDGNSSWDSTGFKQCVVAEPSEKNLVVMQLLCKKFNLTLSYGSFGVKCEGKV